MVGLAKELSVQQIAIAKCILVFLQEGQYAAALVQVDVKGMPEPV